MYTIEVQYVTGNSFGSSEETEQIGLVWADKRLARKALRSIKEHYELYREKSSCSITPALFKQFRSYDWSIKSGYVEKNKWDRDHIGWYCAAEMDDGTWRGIPVSMWCGYFERLLSAYVVSLNDDDEDSFVVRR